MSSLINELVTGILETAMNELLKKSHGRTATKRKRRQTRSATSGRFVKTSSRTRAAKPARKQVSRRRTAASRSKQRSR